MDPFFSATVTATAAPTVHSIDESCKVFISAIPSWLDDDVLKRILLACGSLKQWQRVRDSEGHPLSFGFAEFSTLIDAAKSYYNLSTFAVSPLEHPLKVTLDKHDAVRADAMDSDNLADVSIYDRIVQALEGRSSGSEEKKDEDQKSVKKQPDSDLSDQKVTQEVLEFRRSQAVQDVVLTEKDRQKQEELKREKEHEMLLLAEALGIPASNESKQPEPMFLKIESPKIEVKKEEIDRIRGECYNSFKPVEQSLSESDRFYLSQSVIDLAQSYEREQFQLLSQSTSHFFAFPDPLAPASKVDDLLGEWDLHRQRHVARERADDVAILSDQSRKEEEKIKKKEALEEAPPNVLEGQQKTAQETLPSPIKEQQPESQEIEFGTIDLSDLRGEDTVEVYSKSEEQPEVTSFEMELDEAVEPSTVDHPTPLPKDDKVLAQEIASKLPIDRDELFSLKPDYEILSKSTTIRNNLNQWILTKIAEELGEDPLDVADVASDITTMVIEGNSVKDLVRDITDLVEEGGEFFVMKLWRLVLLQSDLAKAGLI
ncbi:hypothetical protein P9112_003812 [Eukaryota sp. TZLM1-RC]